MTVRSPWVTAGRSGSIAASAASASAVDIGVRGSLTRLGWAGDHERIAKQNHVIIEIARHALWRGWAIRPAAEPHRVDLTANCARPWAPVVANKRARLWGFGLSGNRQWWQRVGDSPTHRTHECPDSKRTYWHGHATRENHRQRDGDCPANRKVGKSQSSFSQSLAPPPPPDLCAIAVSPRFQRWVR